MHTPEASVPLDDAVYGRPAELPPAFLTGVVALLAVFLPTVFVDPTLPVVFFAVAIQF
jgi:hypothetical protein